MKTMKSTREKKNTNVITGRVSVTRRMGHNQQRINYLDPNRKKYNRREGKSIPE